LPVPERSPHGGHFCQCARPAADDAQPRGLRHPRCGGDGALLHQGDGHGAREQHPRRPHPVDRSANGVEVIGPIEHEGLVLSIYFRDNNGYRLELTTPLDKDWNRHTVKAYRDLENWLGVKEKAAREGKDVRGALIDFIRREQRS